MTARIKFITSLMVVALSGVAFAAVAGEGASGEKLTEEQKTLMKQLDANQDGVISESEATAHPELARRFEEIDRNGDARLEKAEFARFELSETGSTDEKR